MTHVVVLDFGSQYTQLIARRVRELGVHSVLLPADVEIEDLEAQCPGGIVLSGGPRSVTDPSALQLPQSLLAYCREKDLPILGICYGLHILVASLHGSVQQTSSGGEYGRMEITVDRTSHLFEGDLSCQVTDLRRMPWISIDESDVHQVVWMSHGDEVTQVPEGFRVVARSQEDRIVAIEHRLQKIYGLQYHPEVSHSVRGIQTLRRFVKEICQLESNWTMGCVLKTEQERIAQSVSEEDHVICALSGGVDSTVAAVLVHGVVGDHLHCVFVDNGLLRYKEQERVMQMFRDHLHLPVTVVDHSKEMLERLKGVTEPEKKRKAIGAEFINAFKDFRDQLEKKIGKQAKYLVQGTLYPDVIESCPPPGSNQKYSHTIKSHHNVGGLPPDLQFQLIEPLKELFKDEVRTLGVLLGVPDHFIKRHPFPGPGLAVRILGDVTLDDRLTTLRLVDEIYIDTIREFGLYDDIWQAFAVFLPLRSVGVQGDRRTHAHVVGLRAVKSTDGMTAEWYPFDAAFLQTVSSRICNRVPNVNRVVYDITNKPPGTIEWE